mmetsp:Transcript_41630/g.37016  ORF Transcript_41630/g.37016 Transcript_41630/m.37016 type:complete len:276 (-) Transcript_41630:400-1227(-)
MGQAYGYLFKDEIKENLDNMFTYFDGMIRDFIKEKLPKAEKWMADTLPIKQLVEVALTDTLVATFFYTPKRFDEEIEAMCAAAGIHKSQGVLINLFPEMTRAACSIVGAWGPAADGGTLKMLRALDWEPEAPVNKNPTVVVYHPEEEGSQVFANIGYAGLVGSLAGMSPKISVAEKEWWPSGTRNETSPYGTPWAYLLRDVLQFGTDISDSVKMLGEAHRTWKLFLGIGSKDDNEMAGIAYAADEFEVYNDQNFSTPYPEEHPIMDGIVYWDKWA